MIWVVLNKGMKGGQASHSAPDRLGKNTRKFVGGRKSVQVRTKAGNKNAKRE